MVKAPPKYGAVHALHDVFLDVGNIPKARPLDTGVIGADDQAELHCLRALSSAISPPVMRTTM